MKDFRDLVVWERSHQFALRVHTAVKSFPRQERFELTSQLKRASLAIPANITEGCGRRGDGEFHKFLQIAFGSANETEYELLFARDLGYLSGPEYATLQKEIVEIKKMLAALTVKVDVDRYMHSTPERKAAAKR